MKKPTDLQIVRAATNDPALAPRTVSLGDRSFKIVDLAYDDYILFLAQLRPLMSGLVGGVSSMGALQSLSASSILQYCVDTLPEMARIICSQTDPDITVADVKLLGKTPFALALIVLAQVEQNQIVTQVKDFFAHIAPLLKTVMPGLARLKT